MIDRFLFTVALVVAGAVSTGLAQTDPSSEGPVRLPQGPPWNKNEAAEPVAIPPPTTAEKRHPELLAALRVLVPDASIKRADLLGVTVSSAKGEVRVPWTDLPPDLAKRYNYAPTEAEEELLKAATEPPKGGSWSTPKPGYPFQARKMRITGAGGCKVTTDANGKVISAAMSPGIHPLIDATVESYAKTTWKGPPRATRIVPITYQLTD